jgi:tetratricopeptide (TPR) repeat protein
MTRLDHTPGRVWRTALTAILALVVSVLGVLATYAWVAHRPDRQLAEARRLIDVGEPSEALAWLVLPEATPRTRDQALLLRARAALGRKRPADAVAPLDAIDTDGPLGAEAALWKGRTLLAVGQTARAIPWLESAIAGRPDDPEPYRWLAVAAYDLGARGRTVAALESVARLDPRDPRPWRTLGLIHRESADHESAASCYLESLRRDALQPRVRLERASSLTELGRFDEAAAELDRLRPGPEVPAGDLAELRARALAAQGDQDAERELLDRALADAPDHPRLLSLRAVLDLGVGRAEDAEALLSRALAADPFDPRLYTQRSIARGALGRDDDAAADSARARDLRADLAAMEAKNAEADAHPDDAAVRVELGRISERLGKAELAASWYRAALACDPRDADTLRAMSKHRAAGGPTR